VIVTHKPVDNNLTVQNTITRFFSQFGLDVSGAEYTAIQLCPDKPERDTKVCAEYVDFFVAGAQAKVVITLGEKPCYRLRRKKTKSALGSLERKTTKGTPVEHEYWDCHFPDYNEMGEHPEWQPDAHYMSRRINEVLTGQWPRDVFADKQYSLVTTKEQFNSLFGHVQPNDLVGFDIETGGSNEKGDGKGLDPFSKHSRVIGLSVSVRANVSCYIPVEYADAVGLWQFLPGKRLVLQNGKFDLTFIREKLGWDLFDWFYADTMLAHHLLCEWDKRHGLKYLTSRYLPHLQDYEDGLEQWFAENRISRKEKDFSKIPLELITSYAAADADATLQLWHIFSRQLEEKGLLQFLLTHVMETQRAYADIERHGWKIDERYLEAFATETDAAIERNMRTLKELPIWNQYRSYLEWKFQSEGKAFFAPGYGMAFTNSSCGEQATGREFLYKNGKPIKKWTYTIEDIEPKPTDTFKRTVMYDPHFFGLEPVSTTPKGAPQVNEDSLRAYQNHDNEQVRAFVESILELQRLTKLRTTYITPVMRDWVRDDGLAHAEYLLAGQDWGSSFDEGGTTSGRISAKRPNFTNMPSRGEGKIQKRMFIPNRPTHRISLLLQLGLINEDLYRFLLEEAYVYAQIDFMQLELRVLADKANEPEMLSAISQGLDLHSWLASEVFSDHNSAVSYEWVVQRLKDEEHPEHKTAKQYRAVAKTMWFAIMYGAAAPKLVATLAKQGIQVSEEYMDRTITRLYSRLPNVKRLKESVQASGVTVANNFGRQRTVLELLSSDGRIQSSGERKKFNFLIQSEGSDIAFTALREVWRNLEIRWRTCLNNRDISELSLVSINGTVHDSVIYSIPSREVPIMVPEIKTLMENLPLPWRPKVHYGVDVEVGPTWGDLISFDHWMEQQQ
jgi:DNA polymerase I-like protein with 3'-5' exonuclease and polymerase domains